MPGPDAAIVAQFENQFDHLLQQRVTRLRNTVRLKTGVTGNKTAFGLLGESAVSEITGTRLAVTEWHDSPSYRRWAVKRDFVDAQALSEEDDLSVIVDLEMGYAQNSEMAMGRQMDDLILSAIAGTAITGANGTDTSAFNTAAPASGGNQVAAGGVGLTVDKMKEAREFFANNNVINIEDTGPTGLHMVISPKQMTNLLDETEAVSSDFVGNGTYRAENGNRMPLVDGKIRFYMGFELHENTRLTLVGAERGVLAWHRDAVGLAIWRERRVWTGDLPEHYLARGLIVKMHAGAVRIQDKGVLRILATE